MTGLTVEFKPQQINVDIPQNDANLSVGVPVVVEYENAPAYAGPYTIEPRNNAIRVWTGP